jgi:hypothetical protein
MLPVLVLASWFAQAEPAPVSPGPPLVAAAPAAAPALDNQLTVTGGYARRLGTEGGAVGPRDGFALRGAYERRIVALPRGFEAGAGLDFGYDKFETGVTGTTTGSAGPTQTFSADRVLSYTSFAAIGALAWRWRRLRPFAQLGAGLTVAYFSTPEMALHPGDLTAAQPLVRAAAGLDVAITPEVAVTARLGFTHVFTHPELTTDAQSGAPATYSFLGDLLDVGAGVALGF